MFHPVMTIRPDAITRSGIIQPFSVRSMDPVQFARHEIDPFINAIRPGSARMATDVQAEVRMDGSGLGVMQANVVPLWGAGDSDKWLFGLGGVALGALAIWGLGRLARKGRRRRR